LIDQRMVNGRAEALRARKGWMPGPATAIPGYAAEAGKARNSVN
jgi:hypothetical protein